MLAIGYLLGPAPPAPLTLDSMNHVSPASLGLTDTALPSAVWGEAEKMDGNLWRVDDCSCPQNSYSHCKIQDDPSHCEVVMSWGGGSGSLGFVCQEKQALRL